MAIEYADFAKPANQSMAIWVGIFSHFPTIHNDDDSQQYQHHLHNDCISTGDSYQLC